MKRLVLIALALATAFAQTALDTITPESLRAHLSYLASDNLEGRATPSPGLDLAADYIARQFRREDLKPGAPDGIYFQTAKFEKAITNFEGFKLTLESGGREVAVSQKDVRVRSLTAIDVDGAPVIRIPPVGPVPPIKDRVVAASIRRSLGELQAGHPSLILVYGQPSRAPAGPTLDDSDAHHAPVVRIGSADAVALFRSDHPVAVSLHLAAPTIEETPLRNVAAILPGSDPALRGQYVLLTAHYDHLGRNAQGIFSGANDNASGTASVIEIAGALARTDPHPRRSILFIAFFGEEIGLVGSRYYCEHPLVPLQDTIADINLEQLGRTDEATGREIGAFAFTGSDYANLSAILKGPAREEGVRVYNRTDADEFFDRSDNYSFAEHGVVDTTIAVAFEFPDYHAIGDKIDKIDFQNLAKVDRAIAAGLVRLADEPDSPKWTSAPGARAFHEFQERPH